MRKITNFADFQLVWWSSILGAAAGRSWAGLVALAAFGVIHLAPSGDRRGEALGAAIAAFAGWAADSGLTALGLLRFTGGSSVAPLWMAGLWAAFYWTLGSSLSWLKGRMWAAAVLGAVGGPAAYGAGARLGALDASISGLAAVGAEWALAAPALVGLHARVAREDPA